MKHKKYLYQAALAISLLLFSLDAGAQCPGPSQRTALLNLQRANEAETTRAGQIALTDTCGNQRYAQYVEINLDTIGYTPTSTGNTLNLSEFVFDPSGALWYIDWQGNGVQFAAGGGGCDEDWLTIGPSTCPESINDSIYTYKYAAIGARYVWPTAELLVNDSLGSGLVVIQGDRVASAALYDFTNETWASFYHGGSSSTMIFPVDGNFSFSTASGTPEAPNFEVEHLVVKALDSLIQFNQYPNTRTDTNAVANFLYTDDLGNIRSQAVDSFPGIGLNGIYSGSGSIPAGTGAEIEFGSFFEFIYPTGSDPALIITDAPPTTARQVDINSTNSSITVKPNTVLLNSATGGIIIDVSDGVTNDAHTDILPNKFETVVDGGNGIQGNLSIEENYITIAVDSTVSSGWNRMEITYDYIELQASDNNIPNSTTTLFLSRYDETKTIAPYAQLTVADLSAAVTENRIYIDTAGIQIQTGASGDGNPGDILRSNGFYSYWDTAQFGDTINIYNSNGSITTNRNVTLADTILWDIGTAAAAFQIEGINNSAFRVSDNALNLESGGAALNLGSGTPVAVSLALDAGTAFITDNRGTKSGIEYGSAGYGAQFTDSTLVHRGYVADMIFDSINTNTVQPPAVENIENSTFTALLWLINEVDCSAGAITVDPPAAPAVKDRFAIVDSKANAATNNITIDFTTATQKLNGSVQDFIMNCDGCYIEFVYMGATTGWVSTK